MKSRAKKFYELFLVVEGSGEFPVDMLRYDSCFPLEGQDASKLGHDRREHRCVVLCRRGASADGATGARWASFGWRVLGVYEDRYDARERAGLSMTEGKAAP